MPLDLRAKILQTEDIKKERVMIEQWGVEVEVRGLSGEERAKVVNGSRNQKGELDEEKFYPILVIASVYDPQTGEKVFKPADRDMLNQKSFAAIQKVAKVAARLSGLDDEAEEKAEKN